MDRAKRHALWGILLVAPAASLGVLAAGYWWPGSVGKSVYLLAKGVLYLAPLVWWKVARASPFPLARPPRGSLREGLLLGLALGGVIVAGWFLVARDLIDPGALRSLLAQNGVDDEATYLAMAAGICLVNALLEEYAFRWFLYGRCRTLLGPVRGALLAALIFTAHHVAALRAYFDWPLVWVGSSGVFAAALVWTRLYERRDSVWPGYVSHIAADVAILGIGWLVLFG